MGQRIDLQTIDVQVLIAKYTAGSVPGSIRPADENYASFDYCFNYFQSFRDSGRVSDIFHPDHVEQSCLQIGFYLASWGMLRGSSFLLGKSARFHRDLLQTIAEVNGQLWTIDVDSYTQKGIALVLDSAAAIRRTLARDKWATDTLVTKIMLGVFGCVPAFDTYFCAGLGVGTLNVANLMRVAEFYRIHSELIDDFAQSICTRDFLTGNDSIRHYTKAKIVDMVGFMAGYPTTDPE